MDPAKAIKALGIAAGALFLVYAAFGFAAWSVDQAGPHLLSRARLRFLWPRRGSLLTWRFEYVAPNPPSKFFQDGDAGVFEVSLWDRSSRKLEEANAEAMGRTLEQFKRHISADLTEETVKRIFGPPDRDLGSGLYVYEYRVREGGAILLSMGPALVAATYRGPDGSIQTLYPADAR